MVAELHRIYDRPGVGLGVKLDPSEMGPPTGSYLAGWLDDTAIAGGGLRSIVTDDGVNTAEIKRMYVLPQYRGRGLARMLLGALEAEAKRLGFQRVRLDTGPKQSDAQHVYETSGYTQIANYNGNPDASYWAEKALTD